MSLRTAFMAGLLLVSAPAVAQQPGAPTSSTAPVAGQDQAIAYNDRLVGLQDRVATKLLAMFATWEKGSAAAAGSLGDLQRETASVLSDAKAVPAFNGDTSLRDSFIPLAQYYSDAANNEFPQFVALLARAEQGQDVMAEWDVLQKSLESKEAVADARFAQAQEAFAARWQFALTPNELQQQFETP